MTRSKQNGLQEEQFTREKEGMENCLEYVFILRFFGHVATKDCGDEVHPAERRTGSANQSWVACFLPLAGSMPTGDFCPFKVPLHFQMSKGLGFDGPQ